MGWTFRHISRLGSWCRGIGLGRGRLRAFDAAGDTGKAASDAAARVVAVWGACQALGIHGGFVGEDALADGALIIIDWHRISLPRFRLLHFSF